MTQIAIACDSYNFILINLLTAAAANRHRLSGIWTWAGNEPPFPNHSKIRVSQTKKETVVLTVRFFVFFSFLISSIFSNYTTVQYWFSLACLPRKTLEKIFLGFSVTRWNSYEWQLSFLLSVLVGFHSFSVENLCCTVSKCNVVTSEWCNWKNLFTLLFKNVTRRQIESLVPVFALPQSLPVTCRSFIVPYSDGLTELDGYHSGYCTLSRGCVIVSFPIYTSIPEPSITQPYSTLLPLHFEEKQKLCSVMEVCIDPEKLWGWNTNRVNRINGAVTLVCGGVSGFVLAVC